MSVANCLFLQGLRVNCRFVTGFKVYSRPGLALEKRCRCVVSRQRPTVGWAAFKSFQSHPCADA